MRPHLLSVALGLGLVLVGCSPFYPDKEPPKLDKLPNAFQRQGQGPDQPQQWWTQFRSPELNQLMELALKENLTMAQARHRVAQAYFVAVRAGAAEWPDATATATQKSSSTVVSGGEPVAAEGFSLGLSLSFELDLWGLNDAQHEAALADLKATGEDYRAAAISMAGSLVQTWVNWVASREQIELLEQQKLVYQKLLTLIENRFVQGQATAMDIYQQKKSLALIDNNLLQLRGQEATLAHQLALLAGQAPGAAMNFGPKALPMIPPTPKAGLPSSLLAQRPDLRAAEARLFGAGWSHAAAQSARFPRFSFTASHTYAHNERETLYDNWIQNLALNLSLPIFSGGALAAEANRTQALADERLAAYYEKVLTAVGEVEDALAREEQYWKQLDVIHLQIQLSSQVLHENTQRYINGMSDFTQVLSEELTLISHQREQIQAQANLLITRAQLHKALGAGWADQLADPTEDL